MIQRKEDFNTSTKQETINSTSDHAISKASSSTTSSSWTKLKDPRIVRVSRAFGGKDRHSKVCTVRGLRDRRVRLSVPTAIQLYDLQDRLGLNQPSKVVDWLLDAAKHEIDELPPLQIPPGIFPHQYHPIKQSSNKFQDLKILNWNDHHLDRARSSSNVFNWEAGKSLSHCHDHQERQHPLINLDREDHVSSNINFLDRLQNNDNNNNPSNSLSNLLANGCSYNSFLVRSYDPPSLTLSHPPRSHLSHHHHHHHQMSDDSQSFSLVPLPSSLNSVPSAHHHHHQQVLVYHQPGGGISTQSYFPEFDSKNLIFQHNSSHELPHNVDHEESNANQSVLRPFHFSTVDLLPSENNHHPEHNKDNDFRLG